MVANVGKWSLQHIHNMRNDNVSNIRAASYRNISQVKCSSEGKSCEKGDDRNEVSR